MLTYFASDGNASWTCPHCGTSNTAHVSHTQMEWTPRVHIDTLLARGLSEAEAYQALAPLHDMVALPPCACGTRTSLVVAFSAQDLAAPNMIDKKTGEPTESHRAAHRHMALAKHMEAAGKPRIPTFTSQDTDPQLPAA